MPVVGPSMGFEQRVMAKLASETSARQVEKRGFMSQSWFAASMGGAFMTLVLMWFVPFSNLVTTTAPTTLNALTVELIPNQKLHLSEETLNHDKSLKPDHLLIYLIF